MSRARKWRLAASFRGGEEWAALAAVLADEGEVAAARYMAALAACGTAPEARGFGKLRRGIVVDGMLFAYDTGLRAAALYEKSGGRGRKVRQ